MARFLCIVAIILGFTALWLWANSEPSVSVLQQSQVQPRPHAESQPANPSAINAMRHPYLFFGESDIATLQRKAATTHQEIWAPIHAYAASKLGTIPPPAPPPAGDLETFRIAGDELLVLAFTCTITQEPAYCALAKRYLLTYATWEQWGEYGWRDLGLAHMLLGNAIGYDWLYNQFSGMERQILQDSLASQAAKMYEASVALEYHADWNNWWRKSYWQNHHWINHAALGMAGLALLHEDERAAAWVDQARSQMARVQYSLNGIQDGSWHESIGYQNYGLTMTLPFLVNLQRILGIDLLPHPYLRNYVSWRLYNYLPDSIEILLAYGNFEWDWGNNNRAQNILRYIAAAYDDPYAEWLAERLIAADGRHTNIWSAPWYVFEFLYYDPTVPAQPPDALNTARVFPDLQAVIWRTGWERGDLVFGLKTGAYGGQFGFDTFTQGLPPWDPPCEDNGCQLNIGHDHDDANGFYLYRGGQWLAPEVVRYGGVATELHNTLLIDGQGQYRPPSYYADPATLVGSNGYLEGSASNEHFAYVAADATRRYKQIVGLEDITRHVLFVRPDYLLMLDNIDADAAHQYTWVSHFGESVTIEDNWVRGNAGDGQILGIQIIAPANFLTQTGNDGQPYVHIQPQLPIDDVRLINLLYPTDDASWATKPTARLVEDTGKAIQVQIHHQADELYVDDLLIAYTQAPTATVEASAQVATPIGPYLFDGQAAAITRDADGSLIRFFVYGGSMLHTQEGGHLLIQQAHHENAFEVSYTAQTVSVSGLITGQVTLYAPALEELRVNSILWPFTREGDLIRFKVKSVHLPLVAE
jgi:hypothetical protein